MTLDLLTLHADNGTTATHAEWSLPVGTTPEAAAPIVASFLDVATTSLGRATAYNDRAEQILAERAAHDAMLRLDRDLYALLLTLDGVSDRARQIGLESLLRAGVRTSLEVRTTPCDLGLERRVLDVLLGDLPPQRSLKLFDGLRRPLDGRGRANNARTRKTILRFVFASRRLELWSVKYRTKLEAALRHAWGVRTTGILRSILAKDPSGWTSKERTIVRRSIDAFATIDVGVAHACVAFVLGCARPAELPLLRAFEDAKTDLAAGARLPPEVLEGLRGVFHKDTPKAEVLRLTAGTLTSTQRLGVQKRARAEGLDVRMDPSNHDAIRLYLYAFEMGMTAEVARALRDKAERSAALFPVRFGSVGVLLDASASMAGGKDQPLRPIAVALALRDMLEHVGHAAVVTCGGASGSVPASLVRPSGDTSLAEGLLDLVVAQPDAIFVISDGYENRPAGRFAEVVSALRDIGVRTPIYQLSPVFAAEAGGVRALSSDHVPVMPVQRPDAIGLSLLRAMLDQDPTRGLRAIASVARRALPAPGGA
jgi:hypothetical protein